MAEEERELEERRKRISEGVMNIFKKKKELKAEITEEKGGIEEKKEEPKSESIEIHKDKILKSFSDLFSKGSQKLYYSALIVIIWIGIWVRTRNLPLLQDGMLPADPDSALFLRYMQTIVDQGSLPIIDNFRYVPLGFNTLAESRLLAHFLASLHKVISVFFDNISAVRVDMLYPIVMFPFIIIAFFFLVKKIFDWKVALVSSAFLAVLSPFLQRTMLGFSDKEPLGVFFFFVAFYFIISGFREERLRGSMIYGFLSGASIGILGLTWGAVSFAFMITGLTFLSMLVLGNFKKKDFAMYLSLLVSMSFFLFINVRFNLTNIITNPMTAMIYFPLLAYTIFFLIKAKFKDKLILKLPHNISSILLSGFIGLLILAMVRGFGGILDLLSKIGLQLLHPFGVLRLTLTVAENQQPFISTWVGMFGYLFWLMILGVLLFLFLLFSRFSKKYKYTLIGISSFFVLALIFSRYKSDPFQIGSLNIVLNGTNAFSQFVFFGGMILFALGAVFLYIKAFRENEEELLNFKKIDKVWIFVLIWFAWLVIGARGAIRLVFLFTPVVAMMSSFFLVKGAELGNKIKFRGKGFPKIYFIVISVVIGLVLFNGFLQAGKSQTEGSFPHIHPQWTAAMDWVKDNVRTDAVFAHWWDYGYWVQTAGERATILDGGNAIPYWDHLIGRYVLTSPNDDEALGFLFTHNATHLLIDPSDIGKYPAYSQIGSDENYDRFSWINSFSVGEQGVQETRDGLVYVFQGGSPLDEDFEWQGETFFSEQALVAGFLVPIEQGEIVEFRKPGLILIKNGQRFDVPLNCIHFNNQIMEFEGEGMNGCLSIIPAITQSGQITGFGNAFYLSPKTRSSLMGRLYILGEKHPNFRLVYPENPLIVDVDGIGRVSPIKIWEIVYPNGIQVDQKYLETDFPREELELARGHY